MTISSMLSQYHFTSISGSVNFCHVAQGQKKLNYHTQRGRAIKSWPWILSYRSLKMASFWSLGTDSYLHSIWTMAKSLAVSPQHWSVWNVIRVHYFTKNEPPVFNLWENCLQSPHWQTLLPLLPLHSCALLATISECFCYEQRVIIFTVHCWKGTHITEQKTYKTGRCRL